MYTLLGASVLGFDLVRRPGGGAVASLLAEALALTAEDLPVLAAARPVGLLRAEDRGELGRLVGADRRLVQALSEVNRLVAAGRVTEALELVERTPVAGLRELLTCVRQEVFDWTWESGPRGPVQDDLAEEAVAVVSDALVAAYHAPVLRGALANQLIEPWATAQGALDRREERMGPCHEALLDILRRLASLDGDGWRRVGEAGRSARRRGRWAPAMHSATWAVHLSGRVRAGASAQLLAVRVLADAELSVTEAAAGVWNLVSGSLQATLVGDLVEDATTDRLVRPLEEALTAA